MKNRKSNRLKGYDYSQDNLYFVTICVKDRLCCFGIVGTGRDLSVLGIGRDLSVRNPNESNPNESNPKMILNKYGVIVQERLQWLSNQYEYVEVHNFVVMPNHIHAIIEIDSTKVKDKSIKIKSLSELIGAFKTTSSKLIHEADFINFSRQRSFHDHIIRNENSYQNISNYIDQNPKKWDDDTFFEKKLK